MIDKLLNDFAKYLTPGHFEGMFLYLLGAITVTAVHIRNAQEWKIGMRGANGRWEAPEICIYIFTWMFPHMVMADQFLGLKASDFAWYFMICLLVFSLTGRFGLEWLLAWKNGSSSMTSIERKESIEITKDQPPAQ